MARPLVQITTDRNMGQQIAIFDAGYDQATLYQDLHAQGLIPIIPLNCHGGEAPEGVATPWGVRPVPWVTR
ncbi:hypothetical protein BFX06_10110 [Sulfobacillus thermosulfidooxidans]|nr:hypothetical protein BFX05_00945 [Sulfobacillus thermosulfidooxidans]OLZ12918.1 hypothetical protein BFX06_10110 [Sulfobacillus thermosulfidooxidans]OLZ21719.1 hypothetical protein BFX07_12945 [Sulfobacillus thermosulfidooxidans]